MSSLGSLNILLSLDSIQFNQALDKSSYQTQKFAKQVELNFTKAQAKAKQFSERTTQYLNIYAILSRKYGRRDDGASEYLANR